MVKTSKHGKRIGIREFKGEEMRDALIVEADGWDEKCVGKYAYFYGTYFTWSEFKNDYIRQIEMPAKYYKDRYGICPYDEPIACYKTVTLQEMIDIFRKSHKKKPLVILTNSHDTGKDAFITRLIMEEKVC